MAGLFLVRTRDRGFADQALAVARDQLARHGFAGCSEHLLPGWQLLHAPYIQGGPDTLLVRGDDLVAVAGTLTCDGKIGGPALEALLTMAEPDWSRLGGQFVALVRRQGRTLVFTDYFAAFQLFHDREMSLFSTSLLAAATALPLLSFDTQGIYEFAFNVMPVGDDTTFAELKTLGPDRIVELGEEGAQLREVAKPLPDAPAEPRIEVHRDRLMAVVSDHVRHFGDSVRCPVSGGLDSRLLLAALRAAGCRPRVYVYGGADSEDVRIARAIAAAEGFELDRLDKEAWRTLEPDAFADQVEANFQTYDALPN